MVSSKKINYDKISMNVMDVIYNRRAVRDYLPTKIGKDLIHTLLDAAIQAPTAMHEEPWSFVIIQNKELLNRLSESSKHLVPNTVFKVDFVAEKITEWKWLIYQWAVTEDVLAFLYKDNMLEEDEDVARAHLAEKYKLSIDKKYFHDILQLKENYYKSPK